MIFLLLQLFALPLVAFLLLNLWRLEPLLWIEHQKRLFTLLLASLRQFLFPPVDELLWLLRFAFVLPIPSNAPALLDYSQFLLAIGRVSLLLFHILGSQHQSLVEVLLLPQVSPILLFLMQFQTIL